MGLFVRATVGLLFAASLLAQNPHPAEITVIDPSGQPVAGVRVVIKSGGGIVASGESDSQGRLNFPQLASGRYDLAASKPGLEPRQESGVSLAGGVEITMTPALDLHQKVEVTASADPVEQGASV